MRNLILLVFISSITFSFSQSHSFCKYIGKKAKVFLKDVESNQEIQPYLFRDSRYGHCIHFEFKNVNYFLMIDRNSGKFPKSYYEAHRPIAAHFVSDFKIVQIEVGKENRFDRELLCTPDEEDSTHITIKLVNSYTNKPLANKKLTYVFDQYSCRNEGIDAYTDSVGLATFKVKIESRIQFAADEEEFLWKRLYLDSVDLKKKVYPFYVRPIQSEGHIPDINFKELKGMKAGKVIKLFKLRMDDLFIIDEPPGKRRGLKFRTTSDQIVYLFIRSKKYFSLFEVLKSKNRDLWIERLKRRMLRYKIDNVRVLE